MSSFSSHMSKPFVSFPLDTLIDFPQLEKIRLLSDTQDCFIPVPLKTALYHLRLERMGFRETILKERSIGLGCDQQEALTISLNGWSKKKQILCIGRNCSFSYSESKMHETQRTYLRNFSKVLFKRYLLKCEGIPLEGLDEEDHRKIRS